MLCIVGQTVGPIWLKLFVDNHGVAGGCYRLKKFEFIFFIFFNIFLKTFFRTFLKTFFSNFFPRASPGPSASFDKY